MFKTENIQAAFETLGKETIQQARSNLSRKGMNVSKKLYDSMRYEIDLFPKSFSFIIYMNEYGLFQDEGVKGATSTYSKSTNSPYKYTNDFPPRKAIDQWVVRKGLGGTRNAQGQFISRKSMVYLIRRSIFNKGIEATNFFTRAFDLKFKRFAPKVEEAFEADFNQMLDFIRKQNRNLN